MSNLVKLILNALRNAAPETFLYGQKTVTTAGTAEQLVSSSAPVERGVEIKALSGNAGIVYVGDSAVSSAAGFQLSAGESVFVRVDDLAAIYLDVDTGGEGVTYIAS